MISVANPSVNDFLASYLENNESDKQEILKNAISVRQLYRLMSEEQQEETLRRLFTTGEILNYIFENEEEKKDFVVSYCAGHHVMDVRYQSFVISYIQFMHDITNVDGHPLPEKLMIFWLFEPEMRAFYGVNQIIRDLAELHEILENQYLSDMVALLQKIDDLFVEDKRESYIKLVRRALRDAASSYCEDVPAADYDIDVASIAEKHREYGIDEDDMEGDIDGDGAAREIEASIKEQVLDEVYGILSKLPKDLFDVSFGDDLEVNVSGIDDLVEDYLRGQPDDYYEEYRDWKADNLEIEYIFER